MYDRECGGCDYFAYWMYLHEMRIRASADPSLLPPPVSLMERCEDADLAERESMVRYEFSGPEMK